MAENKYSVEDQYQFYLRMVSLEEARMHPQQRHQIKQTFYAAWAQTLILLKDDLSQLPEDDVIEILEGMLKEINQYYSKELPKN